MTGDPALARPSRKRHSNGTETLSSLGCVPRLFPRGVPTTILYHKDSLNNCDNINSTERRLVDDSLVIWLSNAFSAQSAMSESGQWPVKRRVSRRTSEAKARSHSPNHRDVMSSEED